MRNIASKHLPSKNASITRESTPSADGWSSSIELAFEDETFNNRKPHDDSLPKLVDNTVTTATLARGTADLVERLRKFRESSSNHDIQLHASSTDAQNSPIDDARPTWPTYAAPTVIDPDIILIGSIKELSANDSTSIDVSDTLSDNHLVPSHFLHRLIRKPSLLRSPSKNQSAFRENMMVLQFFNYFDFD